MRRILGAVCDASILVLRAEKSTRKAAEHARNALLSVGSNVLGVIVNDVPRGKGYEVYGGQLLRHAGNANANRFRRLRKRSRKFGRELDRARRATPPADF